MDDKFRSSIIFFIDILGANILQEFTTFDSIYGSKIPFIYLFIHSFIHSFIYSFYHFIIFILIFFIF